LARCCNRHPWLSTSFRMHGGHAWKDHLSSLGVVRGGWWLLLSLNAVTDIRGCLPRLGCQGGMHGRNACLPWVSTIEIRRSDTTAGIQADGTIVQGGEACNTGMGWTHTSLGCFLFLMRFCLLSSLEISRDCGRSLLSWSVPSMAMVMGVSQSDCLVLYLY
jgi:hypothetical protein